MPSKRKPRQTLPVIFVFCEGQTEREYVELLRTHFRVHIQIETKVLNTSISQRKIDSYMKTCGYHNVDKVFLFYDADRPDVLEKLYAITNAEVMLSSPCVELWFLLHLTKHTSYATSEQLVKLFKTHCPEYSKGILHNQLKGFLLTNWKEAATRAKDLPPNGNPSTTVYLLPEYLERVKKGRKTAFSA